MNGELLQKLVAWRKDQAIKEGVDLFRVLPNASLEGIARELPQEKEEFFRIKGIKERKFSRYGDELIRIVAHYRGGVSEQSTHDGVPETKKKRKVYSVDIFLTKINTSLSSVRACVQGEIQSLQFRGRAVYFSLKDKEREATLSCFMWRNILEYSNIVPEEGMEVIVSGSPNIYKPTGRMSLQVDSLEPVGEGVLKKAYEELKKKLEKEGLFEESRKKALPEFPTRIGLITSRDGAVIHDFLNNVGQFGFSFSLRDSRVEGVQAVNDLSRALEMFRTKDLDVLVIMRGGGSLESLQAFNNEMLVRKVSEMPFPVVCAIGHHQDVPLLSYVADVAVSTPTAAAKKIGEHWETSRFLVEEKTRILNRYMEQSISDVEFRIREKEEQCRFSFEAILNRFSKAQNRFRDFSLFFSQRLLHLEEFLLRSQSTLFPSFERQCRLQEKHLDNYEKKLSFYDPKRALRLGYSLMKDVRGNIIRSVKEIQKDDSFSLTLQDGTVDGVITSIKPYEKK